MAVFEIISGGRVKRFRNRQSRCRHCSKRRKGRPNVGRGVCGWGKSPTRLERRHARQQLREALCLARSGVEYVEDVVLTPALRGRST